MKNSFKIPLNYVKSTLLTVFLVYTDNIYIVTTPCSLSQCDEFIMVT